MIGSADCCARAANGHTVAAPRSVMNSRRLIKPPDEHLFDVYSLALCDGAANEKGRIIAPDAATQCPVWVENGSVGASSSFPLYPTKQTSTVATARSVSCRVEMWRGGVR